MEELHCKGTPAQVARRVLAVLAAEPEVTWLIDPPKKGPATLADLLNRQAGEPAADLPEDVPVALIEVVGKYQPDRMSFKGGYFKAEKLLDHTLLTASARQLVHTVHSGGRHERSLAEDFAEIAPIWSKIKAELVRLDLVIEAEPAQHGPDSGNADLADLNSRLNATAMRSAFGQKHAYDPQRLLCILKCLPAAKDRCEFEQENWMSRGQKYIMLESPGVDETELSRYLRNARKNRLLEWRGIPLPGKPLPSKSPR